MQRPARPNSPIQTPPHPGTRPQAFLDGPPRTDRHQDIVAPSGTSRRPVKAHVGLPTSNKCPGVAGTGEGRLPSVGRTLWGQEGLLGPTSPSLLWDTVGTRPYKMLLGPLSAMRQRS